MLQSLGNDLKKILLAGIGAAAVTAEKSQQVVAELVRRGLVQVDGLEMTKPDRPVEQGARISARGKGKAILYAVGGLSKKGRQMIEVHKLL